MPLLAILTALVAQLPQSHPQYVGMLAIPYAAARGDAGRLDLYAPGDAAHAPVVVFVHAGTWHAGDRAKAGYLGRALARQGLVCVIPSFRPPPAPVSAMARDVTAALAWAAKNVATYGGDPHRIVLVGYASGANLAALAAFGRPYLPAGTLHGVFLIGGVYALAPLALGAAPPPSIVVCAEHAAGHACASARALTAALARAGASTSLVVRPGSGGSAAMRALLDPDDPLNARLFTLAR